MKCQFVNLKHPLPLLWGLKFLGRPACFQFAGFGRFLCHQHIHMSVCLSVYLPIFPPIFLLVYPFIIPQKLTWWGWGFRFCRHISGKHQNGLYKTKNIAVENRKLSGLQNPNTQPHFCWDLGHPALLQNPNHGNPPPQKYRH